jgi:hypothetical protein
MEAICSSKTSVLIRATRRHIPEDGILRSHRHENLQSHASCLPEGTVEFRPVTYKFACALRATELSYLLARAKFEIRRVYHSLYENSLKLPSVTIRLTSFKSIRL